MLPPTMLQAMLDQHVGLRQAIRDDKQPRAIQVVRVIKHVDT